MGVKEEIKLLERAIGNPDQVVLARYGGPNADLRYYAELQELPEEKIGDGVKIGAYDTNRAIRFTGLKNGNGIGPNNGTEDS